jgi:hypothetical protein
MSAEKELGVMKKGPRIRKPWSIVEKARCKQDMPASAGPGPMHDAARRLHLHARSVSGGRGSNCRMAGSSVAARGLAGVEEGCGMIRRCEGEGEGVLGLSAAASHGTEAVEGRRGFALGEGDLTARNHLGVRIASLPLLAPLATALAGPPMQPS